MKNDQKIAITFAQSASSTFPKHTPNSPPITVPQGVKLYLRPFTDDSYLMRLHSFKSSDVTVSIPDGWSLTQYTLSANQLQ